jgi:predicted alpha/beta-fold hydrolase
MSDGELAIVDELMTPTANNKPLPIDAPVVVILHGLSGSSDSNYIRWLLHSSADSTLCSRAVRFLVLHARGAALERAHDGAATGTHRLQRPLFYNAAFTRDLHEFGDATRRQFPAAPLFLVGFSMGGNIATKMLSEAGAKSPFLAACVVCNPFDLNKITDRMLVYPGLIYSQLLVRGLKRFLERNHDVLKHAPFDMAAGMSARTVHEFDKRVVVPLHGYSDVRSYYTEASSSRRVDEITIPFLSFSSGDDPLCDSDAVPRTRCAANSIFAETPFGGHVAHIESMSSVSYIDKVVLAFVDAVLEWRETAAASALSSSS